jgi:Cu-processing system permease protein
MKIIGTLARLTFFEASRKTMIWITLLLGSIFLLVYMAGYHEIIRAIQQKSSGLRQTMLIKINCNMLLLAGLYVVNLVASLMAILVPLDAFSGEISSGTIHIIISKPVRRWEVFWGKWLGLAGLLTVYLLVMAGGVWGVSRYYTGETIPHALAGIGLILLNLLLLLGLSLWGGCRLSSSANGALCLGLYGIAFIGGWLEQLGIMMKSSIPVDIGIATSLLFPSDVLWRRCAYILESPLSVVNGTRTPFTSLSAPSPLMVYYALLYALVLLLLALRRFQQRDM